MAGVWPGEGRGWRREQGNKNGITYRNTTDITVSLQYHGACVEGVCVWGVLCVWGVICVWGVLCVFVYSAITTVT